MADLHKKFHEFALHSALFKGQREWYFSYLKAEKIAQVLLRLAQVAPAEQAVSLRDLAHSAGHLPEAVARFAAAELEQEGILADIFSLLSKIRFAMAESTISSQNGLLLLEEYEGVAQKLGSAGHPSPFVSSQDFSVPKIEEYSTLSLSAPEQPVKDTTKQNYKGHDKGQRQTSQGQLDPLLRQERLSKILHFIRSREGASIKDISAALKEYGEKTIQRELSTLIAQGLVRKEGERRWSVYRPTSGI